MAWRNAAIEASPRPSPCRSGQVRSSAGRPVAADCPVDLDACQIRGVLLLSPVSRLPFKNGIERVQPSGDGIGWHVCQPMLLALDLEIGEVTGVGPKRR